MDLAKHSVIIAGYDFNTCQNIIDKYLTDGILVFWFGSSDEHNKIIQSYGDCCGSGIIKPFITTSHRKLMIMDGDTSRCMSQFNELCLGTPSFDREQYLVEHSRDDNIIVTASAGTGKTTVMLHRLLFLLDMGYCKFSDVALITFTNAAANNMSDRLQKILSGYYQSTGCVKFLRYLEESSGLWSSTIDSFVLMMMKRFGPECGFSSDMTIGSFSNILNGVINSLIDEEYKGGAIRSNIGLDLYSARRTVRGFYEKAVQLGLSETQIKALDWGPASGDAYKLQKVLISSLNNISSNLSRFERRRNSESLSHAIQDLISSIKRIGNEAGAYFGFKHLFIDEFQDCNHAQIELACASSVICGTKVLVVGDVKQGIYRFRGADESAFDTYRLCLKRCGSNPPAEFELIRNYRTEKMILDSEAHLFRSWSLDGLLPRFENPIPMVPNTTGNGMNLIRCNKNPDEQLSEIIQKCLFDIDKRIKRKETGSDKASDCVSILVRTKNQQKLIADLCQINSIPLITIEDRPFFKCEAVRDFFAMVASYVFGNDPVCTMEYILSPYSCFYDTIEKDELIQCDGNPALLSDLMHSLKAESKWNLYCEEFRDMPALSVFMRILTETPVIDNYKRSLAADKRMTRGYIEYLSKRYLANLNKLISMLFERSSKEGSSLYDIFEFLRLSIATNTDELEADVEMATDHRTAVCMTIHKAKGMEFDTVIIPFDTIRIPSFPESEILLSNDGRSVGWRFYKDNNDNEDAKDIRNDQYAGISSTEIRNEELEETRVLYVAMTRAIHTLAVFVRKPRGLYCWSNLLDKE